MTAYRKLTQKQLLTEARARFGDDPLDWAFTCPNCGTNSTGRDIGNALKAHPRHNRDTGQRTIASDILGKECIGRTDPNHGCDWAAWGLFKGPWEIEMPQGNTAWAFALAEPANG